ncbi:MAG: hypothetical protein L6243_03815 [Candidatus Altiarchaeales archaeon]|nr:hypothetical protein [Candidatus Altiarchaeota archaeon]MBU4266925.1 hypothetical protein [Candidatus Altiarchaeota archaeon]MBU4341536.1 hypothetical protein [Candidatus Altiarchaeota archaeon]MBU4437362.1 hypothetical protein [Candidatus Altiarchaeota archaeon]MCG2782696.1 hypothetical protein [Candidatus Altiarchaeales archaeon]
METVTLDVINQNIKELRKEVAEIREHMVDMDCIMTEDDWESIREAERDLKEGKTKRLV